MTTIQSLQPTSIRVARSQAEKRDDDPSPTGLPDIDLSKIDTPAKAAILPVLNAASLYVDYSLMNGQGRAMQSSLDMTLGQNTHINVTYESDDKGALKGTGTAGTVAVKETWTTDPSNGFMVIGNIGALHEQIAMSNHNGRMHIGGMVGILPVREDVSFPTDGSLGLVFDGQIGTAPVHQTMQMTPHDGVVDVHVEGTVGDQPIVYDQTVGTSPNGDVHVTGQGTIAGIPMKMQQDFVYGFKVPEAKSLSGPHR